METHQGRRKYFGGRYISRDNEGKFSKTDKKYQVKNLRNLSFKPQAELTNKQTHTSLHHSKTAKTKHNKNTLKKPKENRQIPLQEQ